MNSNKSKKYICKKIDKETFETTDYCSPDAIKQDNNCCTPVQEIINGKSTTVNNCIDVTDHKHIQELKIKDKLYFYYNGQPHLFESGVVTACPDFYHQWPNKNICLADYNSAITQQLCGNKWFIPPNICGTVSLIDNSGINKGTPVNNIYINQENILVDKITPAPLTIPPGESQFSLSKIPTPVLIGVGSAVSILVLAAIL